MADKQAEKPSKIRRVEYYRLWAGNSDNTGTWDTDLIQIPVTTASTPIAICLLCITPPEVLAFSALINHLTATTFTPS